jgi:hypothetical protein
VRTAPAVPLVKLTDDAGSVFARGPRTPIHLLFWYKSTNTVLALARRAGRLAPLPFAALSRSLTRSLSRSLLSHSRTRSLLSLTHSLALFSLSLTLTPFQLACASIRLLYMYKSTNTDQKTLVGGLFYTGLRSRTTEMRVLCLYASTRTL